MSSFKFCGAAAFVPTRSRLVVLSKGVMIRVVRRNRLLLGMKSDSAIKSVPALSSANASSPHSGEPVARVASITKSNSNVPRYLKRRCTMNASSTDSAASCR